MQADLAGGLERLKQNHAKLKARKAKLTQAIDLCRAQIQDYQQRLGSHNVSISPSDSEVQGSRLHRKISRMIKRKNHDYELTVDFQGLIEDAVLNLCNERKRVKQLVARKNAAVEDLRSVVAIVNRIKGNPNPEEAQALLRHRIHESDDAVMSEKRRLMRQIHAMKMECVRAEERARVAQTGVVSKNNAITALEDCLGGQDEREEACEDRLAELREMIDEVGCERESVELRKRQLVASIHELDERIRQVIKLNSCLGARRRKLRLKKAELCNVVRSWKEPLAIQFRAASAAAKKHSRKSVNVATASVASFDTEIARLTHELAETKRATESIGEQMSTIQSEKLAARQKFNAMKQRYDQRLAKLQHFITTFSSDIV